MRDAAPQAIDLKDYLPPAYLISKVALDVDIRDACATANARYVFAPTDVPVERALADVLVGGPL
jgi:hypothetical protein